MIAINKINILNIEFENNAEYVNVQCVINDDNEETVSEMIINQRVLNRIICKLQATQSDDEVLNYMESFAIDAENVIYSINLRNTAYQNAWIDVDGHMSDYQLIRA
jgi:hypothetical protein